MPSHPSSSPSALTSNSNSTPFLSPPIPIASPLGSSHSIQSNKTKSDINNSSSSNRNSQSDWWKWTTPTQEDFKLGKLSDGIGKTLNNNKNNNRNNGNRSLSQVTLRKRSEEEVKMVGDWRVGKGIGKGTSGKVRIARHTVTSEYSAIKMIKRPPKFDLYMNPNTIHREITVMKLVESPFIVRLLDVFQTQSHIYLVTEYCELGELFHFLSNRRLSEELIHKLFSQLVTALSHLKLHNIAHRDIKFENLLLDTNYNLKLADFGMAIFCPPESLLETSCGSPHYAAPEVIEGVGYDGKIADIWSCGIVLFALISRHLPFDDDNIATLLCRIKTGVYTMHPDIQGEAEDLIRKILIVNPSKRITLEEIINHPYLQQFGEYVPAPYDLPFPLSEGIGHDIPTTAEELDVELVEQLKVVLRAKTIDEVVKSVLHTNDTSHAKTFYAILRNFRARAGTDEDVKDAVIATANRLVINPRRVKSADPILSQVPAVPPPNFELPSLPSPSPSRMVEDLPTSSTSESIVFPVIYSVSDVPQLSYESTRISIDSDAGLESIIFPSFPSFPPEASPVATTSLPGSPNLRTLVPGFRPMTIQDTSQSVPTTPERKLLASDLQLERKLTSPRSMKFSIQKLKTFFSHKSPLKEIEDEGKQSERTPLHIKRSTRMSSFGKALRGFSTSPISESEELQTSPSSSKLLRKKKSWARMDDVTNSNSVPPTPTSPQSAIMKKKSWGWNNRRPTSWISNNENSPPSPTSPRLLPSQISHWIAAGSPTSPITPISTILKPPPLISTPSNSSSTTKRRPSPLQLASITNLRTSSVDSVTKRIDPPPFLSRIQSSYDETTLPLTPERTPTTGQLSKEKMMTTRPEFHTEISTSSSVYSDEDEIEDDNRLRSKFSPPTPLNNEGLLSPPLSGGFGNLDFLSPSIQSGRKSISSNNSSIRSGRTSIKSLNKSSEKMEEGMKESMVEKVMRLERENQGLRIALDLKDQFIINRNTSNRKSKVKEDKENVVPSSSNTSRIPFGQRNSFKGKEKDDLVDMVNKLSFESDAVVEQRWLRMLRDQEFD